MKGTRLQIPRDEVIYREVINFGRWEIDEVGFLAKALNDSRHSGQAKKIFLDIGANTGLISLQVLRKSKFSPRAVLIEPLPNHVDAINFNLRSISKNIQIDVHPIALATTNGISTIFTEGGNNGNSSLFPGQVPDTDSFSTEIELMDAFDFAGKYLSGDERIVLKSDTQGFDASILGRFPNSVWKRIDAAVIEIWAIPEISPADVALCIENLTDFRFVSWSGKSKERISLDEVSQFWLSKNLESRNLFLRR